MKITTLLVLGFLSVTIARAQDSRFSQFYAAPMSLGLSMAGSAGK